MEEKDKKMICSISATVSGKLDYFELKKMLENLGLTDVKIELAREFEMYVASLPSEPLKGFSEACSSWIQDWGIQGGDYSTENFIRRNCTSNIPRELAKAAYNSISDYSKTPFEAASLIETMIDEVLEKIKE